MAAASTDGQDACSLVSLPLEIRHEIYQHLVPKRLHFSPYRGGFQLSPCVASNPGVSYSGYTNRTRADSSAWGPHWRCEDVALRFDDGPLKYSCTGLAALMTACKFMHVGVFEYLMGSVTFHVIGSNILQTIVNTRYKVESTSPRLDYLLAGLVAMKQLSITLRLPASPEKFEAALSTLRSTIPSFKKLRKLDIWIDKEEVQLLSHTIDSAMLNYLCPLADIPDLELSLCLPNRYTEVTMTPFEVHRRAWERSQEYGRKRSGGSQLNSD
ncbi:hypothetical protein BDV96DRAFT_201399 [Lophiotrema nucula]|uniref:Uncharacterized protein n=1 Tax=Lophiotrema nucula TaxID=690887 RepID=A0A6A5YUE7_9PLEO|nr:hypothetical protein BDV96DRAFT_201399 [Lophiotrema nucula]